MSLLNTDMHVNFMSVLFAPAKHSSHRVKMLSCSTETTLGGVGKAWENTQIETVFTTLHLLGGLTLK